VIVRIMGEGQRDVPDVELAGLHELDVEVEVALDSGDDVVFAQALARLLDRVRAVGRPLPDDALVPSELVLPAPDASADDVRHLFDGSGTGLVPG
jgi:hypothetical protein